MVAQLLRLKLDAVVNGWVRDAGGPVRAIGTVVVVAAAVVLAARFVALGPIDPDQLRATTVAVGAVVLVSALLLPAAVARVEPLSPRALVGYGIPRSRIALAVPLTDLVSPHALVLVVLLAGYVVGWASAGLGVVALATAVVLLVGCLLLVRLSATVGAVVARSPAGRNLQALLWTALIIALAVIVVPAVGDPRYFTTNVSTLAERLDRLGVGTVWDAPALSATTAVGGVPVLVALLADVVLAAIWWAVARRETLPARPARARDGFERLGVFRLAGSSPVAGVAARTLTYWIHDPRYRSVLVPLPFVPVLMLLAAWVGGIPLTVMALVPLPVLLLLVGWATVHNDVAYDSTAVWQHVVSPLSGVADRIGRVIPVLALGAVIIAIGVPITVWGVGVEGAWPAALGLGLGALLSATGVSSLVSARFPYAAPPPGAGVFQAPQTAGSSGGGVQVLTILGILLLLSPAVAATALWVLVGGSWAWIALLAGAAVGLIALVIGVLGGGHAVEHRGPELIAFAVRN